jgi:hypothetical protein
MTMRHDQAGAARRLLGLDETADADAVRAARRRLAKDLHPDAGGDDEAMRRINEAADVVLEELARLAIAVAVPAAPPPAPAAPGPGRRATPGMRVDHDVASFTIEALPAEAFEALVVVTTWIGEAIADEPPYQLDVVLTDPLRCWCRLDLVPDAGATTVALTVVALPDDSLPDIDEVRDLWVACLNQLGAPR